MATTTKKKVKAIVTNKAGERVTIYKDGSKDRVPAQGATPTPAAAPVTSPTAPSTGRSIKIDKYDSKTGKGTLSYYARQNNTTVGALAKLNNIQNPDLIYEGADLVLPDQGPQQSTSTYRRETQSNMSELDKRLAETQMRNEAAATETDTTKTKEDPYAGLDEETKTLKQKYESDAAKIMADYDNIQKYADSTHRQLIEQTKAKYRARVTQMVDSNKRNVATKNVTNLRQGRSRYTPELAQDILTDEEYAGVARIAEIESEMSLAIAEYESKKLTADYDAMNAAYDRIDKKFKEMNEQIESNYKMAVDKDKAIREAEKAERDAIKDQFEMGTKRAKIAAPAIVDQLKQFATEAERTAFLEAYSAETGMDLDILMGEVATATDDKSYKELQIANIENQIYNRNRAENRQQNKTTKEEEQDQEPLTNNILNGITKFSEVEPGSADYEKVKGELYEYGMFEKNPPQWFIDEYESQSVGQNDTQAGPEEIQSAWAEYRKARGIM